MVMKFETTYPQAFDRLREAKQSLDRFKQRKEKQQLERADELINEALRIDPEYLRAFYYRGMVKDLLGSPREAVADFERVLNQRPPFLAEVKYNLGVAYFHMYGHPNIKTAISHYEDVVENTDNLALRLLARAGIAHAYAVMMIPSPGRRIEDCAEAEEFYRSEKAREHVSKFHKLSQDEAKGVQSELNRADSLKENIRNEIKWRVCNTLAVQRMFYTDYFDDKRIKRLREAAAYLREADNYSPDNWSVYCNLGSTYMRLGHWLERDPQAQEEKQEVERCFHEALDRLNYVVIELLPNYGFALYEMGRVYRLMGNHELAKHYLDEAASIEKNRAVSDVTLKCERERAEKGSTDYPFLEATPSSK
jgi:tetratricopeptide (TPR) repeat protein